MCTIDYHNLTTKLKVMLLFIKFSGPFMLKHKGLPMTLSNSWICAKLSRNLNNAYVSQDMLSQSKGTSRNKTQRWWSTEKWMLHAVKMTWINQPLCCCCCCCLLTRTETKLSLTSPKERLQFQLRSEESHFLQRNTQNLKFKRCLRHLVVLQLCK